MDLYGDCDPRFHGVRAEFERNFRERGEVGASVCVTVAGRTVVDLWGGVADRHTGRPWQRDTIGLIFSCTKGAVALCAHLLASRGPSNPTRRRPTKCPGVSSRAWPGIRRVCRR